MRKFTPLALLFGLCLAPLGCDSVEEERNETAEAIEEAGEDGYIGTDDAEEITDEMEETDDQVEDEMDDEYDDVDGDADLGLDGDEDLGEPVIGADS